MSIFTWESKGIPEGFSAAVENYGNSYSCDMDAFTTQDSLGAKVPGVTGTRMSRWKMEGVKYPAISGLRVPNPNLHPVTGPPATQPPERAEPHTLPAHLLPTSREEAAAHAASGWQPPPAPTRSYNARSCACPMNWNILLWVSPAARWQPRFRESQGSCPTP